MSSTNRAVIIKSFALAISIFLLIPSFFYQGQLDDLDLLFGNFYLIGFAFSAALSIALIAVALLVRPFFDISKVYLLAAIAIAIKTIFLPSFVPILDGESAFALLWTTAGIWSIASLLIAVGIGAVCVYFFNLGGGLVVAIIAALTLQPLLDLGNRAFDGHALSTKSIGRPEKLLTFSSNHENVLVVLIDTFSSDVFGEIVEDNKALRDRLAGFTYFYNTISQSPYTMLSMMTIYSGRYFEGGRIEDSYEAARNDGIFSDAEAAGAATSLAGWRSFDCPAQHCWKEAEILGTKPIISSLQSYIQLLETGMLRLAPTFAHDWVYNGGQGRLQDYFDLSSHAWGRLSERVIEDFAANLRVEDGPPTFKFLHLMTTHSPLVLDSDCGVVSLMSRSRDNYKRQATCAVRGFVNLLNSLKVAGIYDNTTIVLLGDHGASIAGEPPKELILGEIAPITGRVGRFRPVLTIKPKHAQKPFAVSAAPAQLLDLRKTLCAVALECRDGLPGENIFNLRPKADRERKFIDYDLRMYQRHFQETGTLPEDSIVRYTIGGTLDSLYEAYDRTRRPRQ